MNPLICVIPFCNSDHAAAKRLLEWIKTLDPQIQGHSLLLVADDAVPVETKRELRDFGRTVFPYVECLIVKAPAPVNSNYHVPAAKMFLEAMRHIDSYYKWNWVWVEPDAVPLCQGWLDKLAIAYDACPKRFMGPVVRTTQPGVPKEHMPATMVYPNCAHSDLARFCDGTQAFDMAFAGYVTPRGIETPLIWHRFGQVDDPPRFKENKEADDGPNVGTLDMIPKEAVLFHRNKDGSLIELLRKCHSLLPSCQLSEEQVSSVLNELKQEASAGFPIIEHCATEVTDFTDPAILKDEPVPERRKSGRPARNPIPATK